MGVVAGGQHHAPMGRGEVSCSSAVRIRLADHGADCNPAGAFPDSHTEVTLHELCDVNAAAFDTHPEISVALEVVQRAARTNYDRPFLLIDTGIVREKLRRFVRAMPRVRPHYAMKANPDRRVLAVLIEEGAGFETASISEVDTLRSLGVHPRDILYSNPIKPRADVT